MTVEISDPAKQPETNICLDDIRRKLLDIEDQQLTLDILDNLSKLENQLADKTAVIAKMTLKEQELVSLNNQLFSKVTSITSKEKPETKVTYEDMDRDLNSIIENL